MHGNDHQHSLLDYEQRTGSRCGRLSGRERYFSQSQMTIRDRGATLRFGGGTVSDSILGDGGGTGHLFLLTFYNTKNIGGGGGAAVLDNTPGCVPLFGVWLQAGVD